VRTTASAAGRTDPDTDVVRGAGTGVDAVDAVVRTVVPHLVEGRPPAPDIAAVRDLVRGGALIEAADA